jgi:O-antigen/teichoic acid export membrane protein
LSRLNKSIKNARVALIFYFIALVLAFVSRKIFIDTLGTELVGLSATMRNILGFLNLAELGVYTAVATSLYKPIHDNDRSRINEIISLFGFLYRIIGMAILGLGVIVSVFLPWIFNKTDLDILIIYAAFYTFLTVTLVSYFNNYKQVLLAADQQTYVTTRLTNGLNIIKVALQIVYLRYLDGNYYGWLVLELAFGLLQRYMINRAVSKKYPWLITHPSRGRSLLAQYRDVILKVKQLFAHKIAGFTLSQSSNILIYALTTLTMVTYYTNYTLIFNKVTILIRQTLGSNLAGIGDIIAENNITKIKKVFWEFNALFFWIGGVIVFSFYFLTEPFIVLWLGEEYILPHEVFMVMLFNVFVLLIGQTARFFLNGYALFKDVWAPWAEAIINIAIAIGIGYYYGLMGVVLGVAVSSLLIVIIWKPYFLYREGFKERIWRYWFNILRYMGVLALTWLILSPLANAVWLPEPTTFLNWIFFALCISIPFSVLYAILLYFLTPGTKHLYQRMIPLIAGSFKRS